MTKPKTKTVKGYACYNGTNPAKSDYIFVYKALKIAEVARCVGDSLAPCTVIIHQKRGKK